MSTINIPCAIIRGGTSKAIFFRDEDLPHDKALREKIILRAFGSPDSRQIDGLGGANSLTSKVAIIGKSETEEGTINYTFGQVSITSNVIDWTGNCGNISSAVGMYAIQEKMAECGNGDSVTIKIFNTNTKKNIYVTMPVKDGELVEEGDLIIPGTVFPGAPYLLEFENPAGSVTGKLLPTGNPIDTINIPNVGTFTYSFVDAGNPVIYLLASELGLKGSELPEEVEKMPDILRLIEKLRASISVITGIAEDENSATKKSPAIPKIGFVAPAQDYTSSEGKCIKKEEIDFIARLASMQKMHRAYMVTGAVSTSVASQIEGSVVWNVMKQSARGSSRINIGQPYGPMEVSVQINKQDKSNPFFKKAGVMRTARRILTGYVSLPADCIAEKISV